MKNSYAAENDKLIIRIKNGDESAREELVLNNMKLVYNICSRFTRYETQTEDLHQIGAMGLIRAARDFDVSYNVKFSTYAVPLILGEIKRFLRDSSMIKSSRSLKELAFKAQKASIELTELLGREPKLHELSEMLGVDSELIASAFEAARAPKSLNSPIFEEDGQTLENTVAVSGGEDALLDRIALNSLISKLSDKEQAIIKLRYFHDLTQSQTASILQISQVSVSRMEKKIIKKLKNMMDF